MMPKSHPGVAPDSKSDLPLVDPDAPFVPLTDGEWSELLRPSESVQASLFAFDRALPELLQTHPGQWVVFLDGTMIGAARTQSEAYRLGARRTAALHELVVELVVPNAIIDGD